jgi:hypothetical protein
MANFKKFMVVPYVNKIEKPSDSFIENADKSMSEIIENSEIADDLKMKLYHKNLNKFLLKYDPETYGVTPVLAKLAQNVTNFIERNKSESKSAIKEEMIDPPAKSFKKENNDFVDDMSFYPNDKNYDTNTDNYRLFYETQTPSTINKTLFNDKISPEINKIETQEQTNNLIDLYEQNTNPAASTRSKSEATHSSGRFGDKTPTKIHPPVKITIPNQRVQHSPKQKSVQKGNGRESVPKWATKKFL